MLAIEPEAPVNVDIALNEPDHRGVRGVIDESDVGVRLDINFGVVEDHSPIQRVEGSPECSRVTQIDLQVPTAGGVLNDQRAIGTG